MTIAEDVVIARVRGFLTHNFLYMRPDYVLGEDERFVASRILDSMAVMELVLFVREQFGIPVPEEDILESNLGSLAAVARYVTAQRKALDAG